MDVPGHEDEDFRAALTVVRQLLVNDSELVCAELDFSSGVIVATKRRT
jgi:antitoxin component HigA of HigAB toxin-antitoxin module